MLTESDILTALRDCYDPVLPCNIVDLGLIRSITITRDLEAPGANIPGLPQKHRVEIEVTPTQSDEAANSQLSAQIVNRLAGIEAVILPGGESTTHLKVMREEGLFDALKQFAKNGGAFFGTCAGAILLAKQVHGPAQDSLALLDISVLRNGYGRQLSSDVHAAATKLSKNPLEMVFIRAPIIESIGKGVEVLAEDAGHPVLVREGKIMASTFHPELTPDSTVHEYFLKLVRNGS